MQVITEVDPPPWPGERTVVTIGAYDGVHLGHQAVIAEVKRLAEREGARSVVLTFDRHPATIVRPESAPQLLTSPEQRLELLTATGLDGTVVLHFDEAQSKESPESFIERVLIAGLAVKVVVVGEDFHFGSHREGNVRLLEAYGVDHDFVVDPVRLVERADGIEEPISSTAIRRALAGGDVELAARMLGRQHEVRGKVVRGRPAGPAARVPDGQRRGAQLGLPAGRRRVRRVVRAARAARSTRAPSTSGDGRRSTSTPTTRCSRPTSSTSTATSTASRPRCASATSCAASASSTASTPSRAQLVHDVEHARDLLADEPPDGRPTPSGHRPHVRSAVRCRGARRAARA